MYIIDSSVFIEAQKRYYAFDIVPGFWDTLVEAAENGRGRSIDWVKKELDKGNDELKAWANDVYARAFARTDGDDNVLRVYGQIMEWVQAQPQYLDWAKAQFADGADGWLIAYAAVNGHVVVTEEKENASIKKKVPIPNVCRVFAVRPIDTFTMLREMNVKFT